MTLFLQFSITLLSAASTLAHPALAVSQIFPQDIPRESEPVMPRNPFTLPDGVLLKSQVKEVKIDKVEKTPELVLGAIMIGKTNRIATINNKNFQEGSLVYDKKILEIKKDEVILDDGGDRLTLTLNRPPFPIGVKR